MAKDTITALTVQALTIDGAPVRQNERTGYYGYINKLRDIFGDDAETVLKALSYSMVTGDYQIANHYLRPHGTDLSGLAMRIGELEPTIETETEKDLKNSGGRGSGSVMTAMPGVIDLSFALTMRTATLSSAALTSFGIGSAQLAEGQSSVEMFATGVITGGMALATNDISSTAVHETIHYLSKSENHSSFTNMAFK